MQKAVENGKKWHLLKTNIKKIEFSTLMANFRFMFLEII